MMKQKNLKRKKEKKLLLKKKKTKVKRKRKKIKEVSTEFEALNKVKPIWMRK